MILIYVPCRNEEEAEKIASELLKEKLIACANQFKSFSMYSWEGTVEYEPECVLIAKTTDANEEKVRKKIKELHSYELPAIISLPAKANAEYEAWVKEQVK